MVTLISLIPRRADLTHEQFREHYENVHVPLIEELLPAATEYRRHYVSPQQPPNPNWAYFKPIDKRHPFGVLSRQHWPADFVNDPNVQQGKRIYVAR